MSLLSTIPAEEARKRWGALAGASADAREEGMREWLAAALALEPGDRVAEVEALLAAEAGLDDAALLVLTGERLRCLTAFPAEDARALMAEFERAEQAQPAAAVMCRISALQGACKELTLDEVGKVQAFLPAAPQLAGLAPAKSRPAVAPSLAVAPPAPKRRLLARLFGRT